MIHGSDISNHQGTVDFDALRTKTEFVMAKATEGVGLADAMFNRNWSEARRVGLVRGAYHYGRPDLANSAPTEAEWFLSRVQLQPGDLLGLDLEESHSRNAEWALAFLRRCESAVGFKPLLYVNLDFIRRYAFAEVVAAGYGLWLARWDQDPDAAPPETPWTICAMRQWTSSGALPGVGGRVDRNVFYGTRDQLVKYGLPTPPPPPAPATRTPAEIAGDLERLAAEVRRMTA